MKGIYASPFRVYLALFLASCFGIWMGTGLPVSLFPNSSKPRVYVELSYGGVGVEDFRNSYGNNIESLIQRISAPHLRVDHVDADYRNSSVGYQVEFAWGDDPEVAQKETDLRIRSMTGILPKEIRDSLQVSNRSENSGFFAASFYSETRSLDDIYKELSPLLVPRLSQVQDAKDAVLWNPQDRKVIVELDPTRMASLQLFPKNIEQSIRDRTGGYSAGSIQIGEKNLPIEVKKPNTVIDDLNSIHIDSGTGKSLFLSDIAHIDYRVDEGGDRSTRAMKTSGAPSLILFANPKPGGNVKQMSEDILKVIQELKPQFSKDIQYRVLVDPSEFIRGAIKNVFHEVVLGSLLAVGILFLFIGSFRNVVTAAIEIPLSMVLAFILMRMTGMNLNLISLGGLALASGMNVDASVVVMENIFRHLETEDAPHDFSGKLNLILRAVKEVRVAVIASTISSLVVFAPLAFTSDLSYAVLGDLAKTVMFSHGFSAFVALLLVPTVRLHLLSKAKNIKKEIGHSPFNEKIKKLENWYETALQKFIVSRRKKMIFVSSAVALLAILLTVALPKLPREVLGKPDTDWIILGVGADGNTLGKQMEAQTEEIEARLLRKFGEKIQYTFTQVNGTHNSSVMARLKDKRDMKMIWKALETEFKDEASVRFWIEPWNPAELPLPDPPDLKVVIEGGQSNARSDAAESLRMAFLDHKVLPSIWTTPSNGKGNAIVLRPYTQLETSVSSGDLADLIRVATNGKVVHYMNVNQNFTDIKLEFAKGSVNTMEELQSFPVGVEGKIVPLRALTDIKIEPQTSVSHRENGRDLSEVVGRLERSADKTSDHSHLDQAAQVLKDWKKQHQSQDGLSVSMVDAQIEITDAIRQLTWAILFSIGMIFFTLLFQMGNVTNSLIVLAAIPLGFIGVLAALFVFNSTLSLNSVLGVILLNGIAVGNSIILVDFTETLFKRGYTAKQAVLMAAHQRLRPILITSLTTALGMLPIALGFGQGGRVLQPLGIAVSGGLWVSMSLTLFLVPAIQYRVLQNREMNVQSKLKKTPSNDVSNLDLPFPSSHEGVEGSELNQ